MSTATFNLTIGDLLAKAITSARDDKSLTVEQIIAAVLADADLPAISIGGTESNKREKKPAKEVKEVKTRTRAAPPKARSLPEHDVRCYARTFYDEHIEGGLLKVMRDDVDNLYGDRCKFKKTGETDFCKHHAEKQVLGVWDGEYAGKFKTAVEKTENGVAPAPKKETKPKVAIEKVVSAPPKPEEYAAETEEEEESEVEIEPVVAPEKPKSKPAPKIEEPAEDAEVEDITIDGVEYLIDPSDGTVYDHDSEEEVGRYNIKGKKWIVKPTA
jgi:hypothetical protein